MFNYVPAKKRSASVSGSGTLKCDNFKGIDASRSGGKSSPSRADAKSRYGNNSMPGAVNMIRTGAGEIGKRPGYTFAQSRKMNAVYVSDGENGVVYIDGRNFCYRTKSYEYTTTLLEEFYDLSFASIGKYIFVMTGCGIFIFDTEEKYGFYAGGMYNSITMSDRTYLPTLFIGCKPNGAGFSYEPINLLNPFVAEQYVSDGTERVYTLHSACAGEVSIYFKNESGEWVKTELEEYTENTVTSKNIPTSNVPEGEDNVRIVYKRKNYDSELQKLASCTCGTEFGIGGYKDRAFLSGSKDAEGVVFYSEMDKPLYFPDVNYIRVGTAGTKVVALAGQNTDLAVICNDNVYTVKGTLTDSDYDTFNSGVSFVINGIFKTPKPVEKCTPVIFDNEIVYLTYDGVCAITASGVLDERCCQIRSSNVHKHMLEENLSECCMAVMEDFLIISNGKDTLYILDGKQFSLDSNDSPFSMRVYEAYIWKDITAKYMWFTDGKLYFDDGESMYMFNSGFRMNKDYSDNYAPGEYRSINAYWETPYLYCGDFYFNKFFERMGVLLGDTYGDDGHPLNTDIRVSVKFDNDDWRVVKDYDGCLSLFRYDTLDYSRFTYSNLPRNYSVYKRLLHKKGKGIKLRFENNRINEPFTLKQFGIEYKIM